MSKLSFILESILNLQANISKFAPKFITRIGFGHSSLEKKEILELDFKIHFCDLSWTLRIFDLRYAKV